MKVIHYLNQFFGGIGAEDQAGVGLEFRAGAVGPGILEHQDVRFTSRTPGGAGGQVHLELEADRIGFVPGGRSGRACNPTWWGGS